MTFLIADDSPVNLKLLRAQLEAEGHEVMEAQRRRGSARMLNRGCVDALISDILMPRMDGYRLCREIRKSANANAGVPIVLYTATYSSASDRQLAETVGADFFLIKPAPIADILSAVNEAQSKSRQRQKSSAVASDDSYVLEQYSVALVRKLEDRNNELHDALAILNTAQEHVLELNRNLEIRVEQRTAALRATNRELEAFSYSVSHDLRAPLSTIEGFAQLLNETAGPQLSAEHRELLQYIVTSTKKMGQIIEALLQFARSSDSELGLVEVDLEQLLDEAIAATQSHSKRPACSMAALTSAESARGRDFVTASVGQSAGQRHQIHPWPRSGSDRSRYP